MYWKKYHNTNLPLHTTEGEIQSLLYTNQGIYLPVS